MKDRLEICKGKHCRKHAKINEKLATLAEEHIDVVQTRCLKVCKKTPIHILHRDGKREIFQKIRSKSEQAAFVRYLDSGRMPKRLKQHLRKK